MQKIIYLVGSSLSVDVAGLYFHIFVVMQFSLCKDDYYKDTDDVYPFLFGLMASWSYGKIAELQ